MATVTCPHCHGPMQNDGSLAGTLVGCPHCQGQLWMPGTSPTDGAPAPISTPASQGYAYTAPAIIKIPLLVSAIGNILVALIWLSTCFGSFLAVPCIVLCVFEFVLYARADTLKPRDFISQAGTLAIFEVLVGLFNTITLICGIIILANAPALRRRYAAMP